MKKAHDIAGYDFGYPGPAKPFDERAIVKRVMATIFLISQFATAKAAEMDTMGVGVSTCAAFATKMRKDPVVVENWYFAWAQCLSGEFLNQVNQL